MRCAHFEVEGLARQEAGRPDPHVADCADCQASRATYRRMTEALAEVGMQLYPRTGWEDEVMAKVRPPRRNRWWMAAGLGTALAAAAAVLLFFRTPDHVILGASITRVAGDQATRGGNDWTAGDVIDARSRIEGGAVWLYHSDDQPVVCDRASIAPPSCVRDGDGVRLHYPIVAATYDVIAFKQPAPGAAPADFDGAKALLIRTDARYALEHIEAK